MRAATPGAATKPSMHELDLTIARGCNHQIHHLGGRKCLSALATTAAAAADTAAAAVTALLGASRNKLAAVRKLQQLVKHEATRRSSYKCQRRLTLVLAVGLQQLRASHAE